MFVLLLLLLLAGNVIGSIAVYFLFGDHFNVPEFIALYTSILTAIYTISEKWKGGTK
jgi:hypothetical protein